MSIIIFLKYKNFVKEYYRNLFNKENILWAGHSAFVFDGDKEDWDEILLVAGMDDTALDILKGESKIENYKVFRLSLASSETVKKANESLDAFAKKDFDMTEGAPFAEDPNDSSFLRIMESI
ncbi:MAG: hypothetical protein ACTSRE_17140, partial [Promethearchaeota archaeon]